MATASLALLTLHIPPGNLGIGIQEAWIDGTCLVVSKTNAASPLQVGDTILSFNGVSLAPRRQSEWVNTIQKSPQHCTRTVVVRRRQVNSTVNSLRVPSSKSFTKPAPAATPAGSSGQRLRSLEDGAKFTESQNKLMRMKESREAEKRKKDGAARRARDELEVLNGGSQTIIPVDSAIEKVRIAHGYHSTKPSPGFEGNIYVKTAASATPSGMSNNPDSNFSRNTAVSQTSRSFDDLTESQKMFMKVKETREARQRRRRTRDQADTLDRERTAQAQQFEMERKKQERTNNDESISAQNENAANSLPREPGNGEDEISRSTPFVMVSLLENAMAKVEALESDLRLKNESHKSLESEIEKLISDLGHVKGLLDEEKQINQQTIDKLTKAEEKVQVLEKEVMAKNDSNEMIRQEYENLRRSLSQEDSLQIDAATLGNLRKELSIAKDTEDSLRKRILALECDKYSALKERDDARRKAERYNTLSTKLQDTVKEHISAIDSLVALLERQRETQAKDVADRDMQIASLKSQLSALTFGERTISRSRSVLRI